VNLGPPRALAKVGLQITERDQRMLAFAAEHPFVLGDHLARLLDVSKDAATARMRALRDAGLLTEAVRFHGEPPLFQLTTAGRRAIGSDLPSSRPVNLATYRHDAGLAWLAVAAERGMFGPLSEIVCERRMRSEDRRGDERAETHGVRLGSAGRDGRPRLHYPDLVVRTTTGHRVAFELELSGKGRRRREQILAAYAADRRIDAVVYLVDRPARRRALQESVRRVGISDRVRVEQVRLGHGDQQPAAGGAARSARRSPAAAGGAPRSAQRSPAAAAETAR
jgi:DNA-binding transcriptional ArsR family regulator